MQQMKFRGFRWPNNPKRLEISRSREMREWVTPFSGQAVQDFGCGARVVSGEGEFFGAQRQRLYEELESLLRQGGEGILSLPETRPFFARFVRLERIGEPGPEILRYRFEFRESGTGELEDAAGDVRFHFCGEGENLWDIAAEYRTSVEALAAANPQIEWPNVLDEGERVVIP